MTPATLPTWASPFFQGSELLSVEVVGGLVALLVAAMSGLTAVLVRRSQARVEMATHSGTIQNSEASLLWKEAESIREYLTSQLRERDKTIDGLKEDLEICIDRSEECEKRERLLERRIATLERKT